MEGKEEKVTASSSTTPFFGFIFFLGPTWLCVLRRRRGRPVAWAWRRGRPVRVLGVVGPAPAVGPGGRDPSRGRGPAAAAVLLVVAVAGGLLVPRVVGGHHLLLNARRRGAVVLLVGSAAGAAGGAEPGVHRRRLSRRRLGAHVYRLPVRPQVLHLTYRLGGGGDLLGGVLLLRPGDEGGPVLRRGPPSPGVVAAALAGELARVGGVLVRVAVGRRHPAAAVLAPVGRMGKEDWNIAFLHTTLVEMYHFNN